MSATPLREANFVWLGRSATFAPDVRQSGGNFAVPKKAERVEVIPQHADELTPKWFSSVLPGNGQVTDVKIEEIGTDVGFIGQVFRCHLTWQEGTDADQRRPSSVIVKVPTSNDENFALGDGLQLYEREIMVYRELRETLGLPMPDFLYGAMDPDPAPWIERPLIFLFDRLPIKGINWVLAQFLKVSGNSKRRYVLVLEDIVDARPPTQAEGGSLDDVLAALKVLAAFHARNWMRREIVDSQPRVWAIDRACRVYQASYVRNLEAFRTHYSRLISPEMFARLDEINERAETINRALGAEPWTLVHGDYRLDNLLFRPSGEIVVLDLQSLAYGRPALDVAYFVTTALTGEHRDQEELLLRTYHDALVSEGVSTYSLEQLTHDCHLAKELFAHRIVGAADVLDTDKTDGSEALMDVMQLRILEWLAED